MKRIALALTASIWALAALAAYPEIKFDTTDHDCGTIRADKGALSWTYKFTNTERRTARNHIGEQRRMRMHQAYISYRTDSSGENPAK